MRIEGQEPAFRSVALQLFRSATEFELKGGLLVATTAGTARASRFRLLVRGLAKVEHLGHAFGQRVEDGFVDVGDCLHREVSRASYGHRVLIL